MVMEPSDYPFNLERSMNKFLFEQVGPTYKVYFSERAPEDPSVEQWVEMNWVDDGYGQGEPAILQLDCRSKIEGDKMRRKLKEMRDFVIEKLNVDEITLYDFTTDPKNPVPSDVTICPRCRGRKWGPNERDDSIAVYFLSYHLYVWRPDTLP